MIQIEIMPGEVYTGQEKTKGRLEKYREGLEKLSRTNRMRKMKKQMRGGKGGGSNAAVRRRDRREN